MKDIALQFDIRGSLADVKPLGDGLINSTYIVTTGEADSPDYVLQRVNTAVFRDPRALQENLVKITDHIRKRLQQEHDTVMTTLTPVRTRTGALWLTDVDGGVWRMTEYIAGSCTPGSLTSETARLTGEAFGRFHGYFAGDDAPVLEETIPDFHNVQFRIDQLREAMERDSVGRAAEMRDVAERLLAREEEMTVLNRLHAAGRLPKRTTHCDTKLNNILFDRQGRPLCVIDLDTTMPGFVMSDFGDFMRTAANKAPEDEPDTSRIALDMDIFKGFARGYVETARAFLTPLEKELLPFGARMLTYMQTVRFLTDYLDGDVYYKIKYPLHNRVRTMAQLRLLECLDEAAGEMDAYIRML